SSPRVVRIYKPLANVFQRFGRNSQDDDIKTIAKPQDLGLLARKPARPCGFEIITTARQFVSSLKIRAFVQKFILRSVRPETPEFYRSVRIGGIAVYRRCFSSKLDFHNRIVGIPVYRRCLNSKLDFSNLIALRTKVLHTMEKFKSYAARFEHVVQ